jgi:hypothetical protein
MDNILKLLIGVLSVAGLLAMLTPTHSPEPQVVAQTVPAPTEAVITDNVVNPEESLPEEPDDEVIKFGEPMIDGKPIMDEENGAQVANNFNQDSGQMNNASGDYAAIQNSPPPEAYADQQSYGQQPMPSTDTGY